jgi:hypothetical protein
MQYTVKTSNFKPLKTRQMIIELAVQEVIETLSFPLIKKKSFFHTNK